MIVTLAWKEYREQRSIWLAMAGLAALLILGLPWALSAGGSHALTGNMLISTTSALIVAATYGLVCGSALFASEREAGTLMVLDVLTGRRSPLWRTKVLAGALLTLGQSIAITVILAPVLDLDQRWPLQLSVWFAVVALAALEALAWGMLFSALCKSALAAAGAAALALTVSWMLSLTVYLHTDFGLPTLALFTSKPGIAVQALRVLFMAGALAESWRIFCRDDLSRDSGTSAPGWAFSVWLALRKRRGLLLLMAVAGFLAGLLLPLCGLLLWPAVSLLIGVACGAVSSAGQHQGKPAASRAERSLSPGRDWAMRTVVWLAVATVAGILAGLLLPLWGLVLWPAVLLLLIGVAYSAVSSAGQPRGKPAASRAERSLSPGWDWVVRTAVWLAVAVGLALLVSLAGMIELGISDALRPPHANELQRSFLHRLLGGFEKPPAEFHRFFPVSHIGMLVILWLVNGFALAQALVLVVRIGLVAAALAVVPSAVVTGICLLSLVGGSMGLWQILVVPALLLAAGRLAAATGKPKLSVAGGCLLSLAWIGGGLAYRILEVPDGGEPFDVPAYRAGLQSPAQNEALRLVLLARRELNEQIAKIQNADKGLRLNRMFELTWPNQFREAAAQPNGIVEDPRPMGLSLRNEERSQACATAVRMFTDRALQLQARGDPAAALDHLAVGLALSRLQRRQAMLVFYFAGQQGEQAVLKGFNHWLDRVGPRRELLRRAQAILSRHEAETPPLADAVKAEYLVYLNSVGEPAGLLRAFGSKPSQAAEFLDLAWQTPWEKARRRRILNAVFAGYLRFAEAETWQQVVSRIDTNEVRVAKRHGTGKEIGWLPPGEGKGSRTRTRLETLLGEAPIPWIHDLLGTFAPPLPVHSLDVCRLRATQMRTALALFLAKEGRPAERLEELVPRYLPALPADPFTGQLFHYRVSPGERMAWDDWEVFNESDRPSREIRAGQGILWTFVPDPVEEDGRKFGDSERRPSTAERPPTGFKVIFLVPHWPKPRARQ